MVYPYDPELVELQREMSALESQINKGVYTDPNEIWDMCQRLIEAGKPLWAEQLAQHLPD